MKLPICAKTANVQTYFKNVDFPPIFGPVSNKTFSFYPNYTEFGTISSKTERRLT